MSQFETHPGDKNAPSFAVVANPMADTNVHHDHQAAKKKHRKHRKRTGPQPHGQHEGPEQRYEFDERGQHKTSAGDRLVASYMQHVDDRDEEEEDLLDVVMSSMPGKSIKESGANRGEQGFGYDGWGEEDGSGEGEGRGTTGEEYEVLTTKPRKEPGEPSQGVHFDMPQDATSANLGNDMSKSPKELNEVKGTQGQKSQTTGPQNQRTFLEKHCDFFDPDGDGQIWPMDTFFGFWVLGFSLPICLFSVFAIHFAFSWPTQHWFPIPDLFWRINIDRIGKHGSDSGAYDHDGGFDKNAFDRMFTRNAKTHKDLLTGRELLGLMLQNKVIYDPFGWFGGAFEWLSVYLLFWPRDNMFRQEDIRGLYDGSTFYEIAREQKKKGRYTPPGWEDTVSGFRK